jgi:hypothetical protein
MSYNVGKVDDAVLALLYLTSFSEHGFTKCWKGHSWEVLDRLHAKGWISDPKSKAKSVVLSKEGAERSEALFAKMFGEVSADGRSSTNQSVTKAAARPVRPGVDQSG